MKSRTIISVLALAVFVTGNHLSGQVILARRWASPDFLVARIHAHANLVRAESQARVDFAEARNLNANAARQEIENSIASVKAYWERKKIREEALRPKRDQLIRQGVRDTQTWKRLRYHPELVGASVPKGEALNFIKNRLSTYPLERLSSSNRHVISESTISALLLRQPSSTGAKTGPTFPAGTGRALDPTWWPYLLRDDRLKAFRDSFSQALNEVRSETKPTKAALDSLEDSLGELGRMFYRTFDADTLAHAGFLKFRQYRAAENHLRTLHRDVLRVQETDNARTLNNWGGYDPSVDGKNIYALVKYMRRNGVDFAAAKPGNEHAYYAVFDMLKEVYVELNAEEAKSATKKK